MAAISRGGSQCTRKEFLAERSIRFSLIPKWKIISIFMKDDEKMIDKFMDSSLKCNLAVAEGEPQMVDYWFSRRADWMAKWAFPRKNNDLLRWRMHNFSFNGNFFAAWIGHFYARPRVIWVVKPVWRWPWRVFGWRRLWPSRFQQIHLHCNRFKENMKGGCRRQLIEVHQIFNFINNQIHLSQSTSIIKETTKRRLERN